MLSRHPTGGRAHLFDGLASVTQEEKVRLSSREALAASEVRLILVSWVVEPRRGSIFLVQADGRAFVWPGAPRRRPTGD